MTGHDQPAARRLNEEARNIGRAGSGRALITPSDSTAAQTRPTAITGTWSDLERHAWYVYENIDRDASDWELAEAVLVLLGLLDRHQQLRDAASSLVDWSAHAVCEPRRFMENEANAQQELGSAVARVRGELRGS